MSSIYLILHLLTIIIHIFFLKKIKERNHALIKKELYIVFRLKKDKILFDSPFNITTFSMFLWAEHFSEVLSLNLVLKDEEIKHVKG